MKVRGWKMKYWKVSVYQGVSVQVQCVFGRD